MTIIIRNGDYFMSGKYFNEYVLFPRKTDISDIIYSIHTYTRIGDDIFRDKSLIFSQVKKFEIEFGEYVLFQNGRLRNGHHVLKNVQNFASNRDMMIPIIGGIAYFNNSILTRIRDIACGCGHFLFLDEDGAVHGYGMNHNFQLGSVNYHRNILRNVKQISASDNYSAFLTEFDQLYVCGNNCSGILGLPEKNFKVPLTLLCGDVVQVHCTPLNMVYLKRDHSVWITGSGIFGQYGNGSCEHLYQPVRYPLEANSLYYLRTPFWSPEEHRYFSSRFKNAVMTFCLIIRKKIPKFIKWMIIKNI